MSRSIPAFLKKPCSSPCTTTIESQFPFCGTAMRTVSAARAPRMKAGTANGAAANPATAERRVIVMFLPHCDLGKDIFLLLERQRLVDRLVRQRVRQALIEE